MTEIIKKILSIIGDHYTSKFTINFLQDEIWLEIYETEVIVVINTKNKQVYMDCETMNNHLTGDMLNELSQIIKVLEGNIDEILSCINYKES